MSTAIVVGGGVSGLLACRMLAGRHDNVILVEKEPALGGLLRSEKNELGLVFDQGTHFISGTMVPELDEILFADLSVDDCHTFTESMLVGSYFDGHLSTESDCINTRTLPRDIHDKGVVELLNAAPDDSPSANLEDFLVKNYGPTFAEHVFAPIVKKFAGVPPDQLHPAAAAAFAVTRLVIADSFASTQLKKSEIYDQKIAWARRSDGSSNILKLYSKTRGVGAWVESLENRIRADGVRILTGCSVTSVELEDGKVKAFDLDNGDTLECDEVVWTVPPVFFLKVAGVEINSKPPKFRNMVLLHYSIDTELSTDLHCVVNYDPALISFRITLFPNITNEKRVPAPHHLTVEVMIDDYQIDDLSPRVFAEMKAMGIIPDNANILHEFHQDIRPGWPILTQDFHETAGALLDKATQTASNVTFAGRGKKENSHFMHAVLEDLYHALS